LFLTGNVGWDHDINESQARRLFEEVVRSNQIIAASLRGP
jgi:hypothetical protein